MMNNLATAGARPDLFPAVDKGERDTARQFGFRALTVWAGLGFVLESAHAFKLSAYLDQPLRRELLRWAHAHGVGMSLVVLAYAAVGVTSRSARYGKALRIAAALMPSAFALAIFGHSEADPGPSIWFVPIAALLLLYALFNISRSLRA
jgi:hypothetical protein